MENAIIIPILNEVSNIETLLEGVCGVDSHLHTIVVNDGSVDGTADAVRRCAQKYFCAGAK